MMEENGGNVLWVNRAFGSFLGFVNAQCNMIQNLVNLSLLVLMFLSYLPIDFHHHFLLKLAISGGFLALNLGLNIFGVDFIGKLSWFLLVIINAPFFVLWVLIFINLHDYSFHVFDFFPISDVHWALMISTLVWSYGGFDQMGSLAGEVKGGSRTYILGVLGSFPFIQLNYLSPVMASWLVFPQRAKWTAGAFERAAMSVSKWFGYWVLGAACCSSFASYVTGLPPVARNVWAMAKGLEGVQSLPSFLGWSWRNQPIGGLLFTIGVSWVLSMTLSFNYLVQVYLVVRLANLFIEFFSLLKLRWSEPDTPRPFKIAGGWFGVLLITFPTFAIGGFALATMDHNSLIVGLATLAVVVLLYFGVVAATYIAGLFRGFYSFESGWDETERMNFGAADDPVYSPLAQDEIFEKN